MSGYIDPAIVEKALNATGWVQENREYLRDDLTRALEAAAPLIAARAWDEAIANLIYPDGTPVEIIANDNPYRADALEAGQS